MVKIEYWMDDRNLAKIIVAAKSLEVVRVGGSVVASAKSLNKSVTRQCILRVNIVATKVGIVAGEVDFQPASPSVVDIGTQAAVEMAAKTLGVVFFR